MLDPQLRNASTDITLSNCLFGSENVTRYADSDKYKYGDHRIGFSFRIFVYRWKHRTKC